MPLHPLWGQVAKEEPDARAKAGRGEKSSKLLGWMEPVFCVNCGAPHGMVTKGSPYIFYLCDECVEKHGKPPGTVELSEDAVRQLTQEVL